LGLKNIRKAKKYLIQYQYSSYPEYNGINREENKILNRNVFPEYFTDIKDHEDEINDWLNYNEQK